MLATLLITTTLIIAGPIPAKTLKVKDGDTIVIQAEIWPSISATATIRLRGIDAPELSAPCKHAQITARKAKQRLTELTQNSITLYNIRPDLYNRLIADIRVNDQNIATLMLNENLARPSKNKRAKWC